MKSMNWKLSLATWMAVRVMKKTEVIRYRQLSIALLFGAMFASTSAMAGTERVSLANDGAEANAKSEMASVSANGRYVAFISNASNLVPNDTNGTADIFVRDLVGNTTKRVSVTSNGEQRAFWDFGKPSLSANGRYIAFYAWSKGGGLALGEPASGWASSIYVHDQVTGVIERVIKKIDGSFGWGWQPSISADGRYVAFQSTATDLVAGSDNNSGTDVFVSDRVTGTIKRVSVSSSGVQADGVSDSPAISADGRYVAFWSSALNLVPGDNTAGQQIYVHDVVTGTTERVSVATDGSPANYFFKQPAISADGRYVAYASGASNIATHVFVHDRELHTTTRASVASDGTPARVNSVSFSPAFSADGRYVFFDSGAPNLVSGDLGFGFQDVFRHDMETGATVQLSVSDNGTLANGDSNAVGVSADGQVVVFASSATNLVPGDTNGVDDIFVRSTCLLP